MTFFFLIPLPLSGGTFFLPSKLKAQLSSFRGFVVVGKIRGPVSSREDLSLSFNCLVSPGLLRDVLGSLASSPAGSSRACARPG